MDKREQRVLKQWERALKKQDFAATRKIMHRETSAGYQVYDFNNWPVAADTASLCYRKFGDLQYSRTMFEHKTVMDIGCSMGFFSILAATHGATSVIGYDQKELYVEMNNRLARWYRNKFEEVGPISFVRKDLSTLPALEPTDVVICNSLIHWFVMKGVELGKIMEWLASLAKEAVYFEGTVSAKEKVMVDHNVPEEAMTQEFFEAEARKHFVKLEMWQTTYNPERFVYRLWKRTPSAF